MSTGPEFGAGVEQVEIDTLMLADWAETINGKLYVQGGGWDRWLLAPDRPVEFAIAASVLTPWSLANQEREFAVAIESEDGAAIAPLLTGSFTVGRPPNARPGQLFRSPITARVAMPKMSAGVHRVVMNVTGAVSKSVVFYAVNPSSPAET